MMMKRMVMVMVMVMLMVGDGDGNEDSDGDGDGDGDGDDDGDGDGDEDFAGDDLLAQRLCHARVHAQKDSSERPEASQSTRNNSSGYSGDDALCL